MKINTSKRYINQDPIASHLAKYLQDEQLQLGLQDSNVYFDYPLYKDMDGDLVISKILVISQNHGVIAIGTTDCRYTEDIYNTIYSVENELESVFDHIYSRLIRNKKLKSGKRELIFECDSFIFAPSLDNYKINIDTKNQILTNYKKIQDYFESIRCETLKLDLYNEIISTIDGAKALARSKIRPESTPNSKGDIVNKLETEILLFDQHQRHGYMVPLDGMQRIRGLAGSGKTVILAMKAALTHLRYPKARILYTFYTKSLYQLVQNLITRFYRQFDDAAPDFERIKVMHAWGGNSIPGVYYETCKLNNIEPITYTEASRRSTKPFDYICLNIIDNYAIKESYDYIFIDEGQDFPASFVKLCTKLAKKNRIVWAYDDLQTIFQAGTPSQEEIVGTDATGKPLVELSEDVVLYKCYRNPREILVCAHAVGFGIYGERIVQLLESPAHWEDVGYKHISGEFFEGEEIVIERPEENSLKTISELQRKEEIISAHIFDEFSEEIKFVVNSIKNDIDSGLRPDDILVITLDDRNAKSYLNNIISGLAEHGLSTNNIHADNFGLVSFEKENCITLSTIHKAKGNESYMVYIVGIDAMYITTPSIRYRNRIFTALTRAKGWVRISGIQSGALQFKLELDKALENFPYLKFTYPGQEQLKIMRRDLKEKDVKKAEMERMLDKVMGEMSIEEIEDFLKSRAVKKIM